MERLQPKSWQARLSLWFATVLINGKVDAVATTPVLVANLNFGSYPVGPLDPQKDIQLTDQGYTLTKVEVSKTSDNQMDGFQLYFTPNAGGADVVQRFGYFCTANLVAIAITKPVIAVTDAGSKPNVGFIFHHPDGTTTETATIAGRATAGDIKMDLCGNFIGMKCSFHNECAIARRALDEDIEEIFRGRKLPVTPPYGTSGCSMYYDSSDINAMFMQKIPNVMLQVGEAGITTTAWETSCSYASTCSGTVSQIDNQYYYKNGVALTGIPTFLAYNSTTKTFTIASQTDSKNVGVYTVTLESKITVGAVTSDATHSFTITIQSDCDTTTIYAPNLSAMTVVLFQSATQDVTFTDSIANVHGVEGWCGPREYTISSSPPSAFFSVTGTTFTASPTQIGDVGTYNVALQFGLTVYPSIAKQTSTFNVTVVRGVLSLSFTTEPAASITVQVGITNQPIVSQFVVSQTPNCQQSVTFALSPPIHFVSLSSVTADSGSIQINGASLSDHNLNPYVFSLSATIGNVTTSKQINVVVKHPCSTTTFSIFSIPTFSPKLPGSNLLEQSYTVTNSVTLTYPYITCEHSPISLLPSVSYLTYDAQKIYLDETKMVLADQGIHIFILIVNSKDYSTSALAGTQTVTVDAAIISCATTQLTPLKLNDMKFQLQQQPTVQEFNQVLDTVGQTSNQPDICGSRTYKFDKQYPFLSIGTSDGGPQKMKIQLSTNDLNLVGNYTTGIVVGLKDYPQITPILFYFKCTISAPPKNKLPFFETPLPTSIEVTMTDQHTQWKYQLPQILDADNDEVKLSVLLGTSSLFVQFDHSTNVFIIPDIQVGAIEPFKPGHYSWQIQLDDSHEVVSFTIVLIVSLPPETQLPVMETNSTQTNITENLIGWQPEAKVADRQEIRQDFPLTGNPSTISMSGGFVFQFSMPLNMTTLEDLGKWNSTNVGSDYFKFQLIPGDQYFFIKNQEAYEYNWNITRYTNTTIDFQLHFTQYMIVSQQQTDSMRFQILKPEAFVSYLNGKHIDFTSSLHRLPKQVRSIEEQKLIQAVQSKLDRFLQFLSAQSFINILLSQSLHLLWGMVNTQQIIVLTVLFNLKTPVNTQKIEIIILKMVSFDIFKMDAQLQRLFEFDLEASPPLNQRFADANYETSNFLLNMGDMFLLEIIYILLIGLVPLTRWLVDGQFPAIERYLKSFKLFNNFLRFYLESQMEICICSLLTFRQMNRQSWRQPQLWFANICAFGNLCMLAIMLFIVGYVALKYHSRYRTDRHYREQYDDIFGELRGDRKLPMLYFCFFTIRRYAIACSLIAMPQNFLFQIFLHVFSSICFLVVLLIKKLHKDQAQAKKEIFDEMTILLTGYFLFLFTDFVSDENRNSQAGWALVMLIFTHLAINVSLILWDSFIAYKQKARKLWLNYKLRKLRRQRLEAQEAVNQALAEQGNRLNQSELISDFSQLNPDQQLQRRVQIEQDQSRLEEEEAKEMYRGPQDEESYSQQEHIASESEESESESEKSDSRSEESESDFEQIKPEESKQQLDQQSYQQQPEESKRQPEQQLVEESKREPDVQEEQKYQRKRFLPVKLHKDPNLQSHALPTTKRFWPVPPDEIDPELYEIYGPSDLSSPIKKTEEKPKPLQWPILKFAGLMSLNENDPQIDKIEGPLIPVVYRSRLPSDL